MWYIKLLITLFLNITTIFSMDQTRQVITFQLFDEKIMKDKESNSILFYINNQGNIISSETSIEYILLNKHLKVIQKDWGDVNVRRSVYNNYLMQTELQKEKNNYIQVTINYD